MLSNSYSVSLLKCLTALPVVCGNIWPARGKKGKLEGYVTVFGPIGRPKGVKEQDVYICDYRLDKSAHLFYKIHRNRYPVCTKPYAFDHFPKKLTPKRDFSVSLLSTLTVHVRTV